MRHSKRMGVTVGVVLALAVTGTAAATKWGGPREGDKGCNDVPETSQLHW